MIIRVGVETVVDYTTVGLIIVLLIASGYLLGLAFNAVMEAGREAATRVVYPLRVSASYEIYGDTLAVVEALPMEPRVGEIRVVATVLVNGTSVNVTRVVDVNVEPGVPVIVLVSPYTLGVDYDRIESITVQYPEAGRLVNAPMAPAKRVTGVTLDPNTTMGSFEVWWGTKTMGGTTYYRPAIICVNSQAGVLLLLEPRYSTQAKKWYMDVAVNHTLEFTNDTALAYPELVKYEESAECRNSRWVGLGYIVYMPELPLVDLAGVAPVWLGEALLNATGNTSIPLYSMVLKASYPGKTVESMIGPYVWYSLLNPSNLEQLVSGTPYAYLTQQTDGSWLLEPPAGGGDVRGARWWGTSNLAFVGVIADTGADSGSLGFAKIPSMLLVLRTIP